MMKRIISGIAIFAIVLAVFFFANQYVVDVFVALITARSIFELYKALEVKGHNPIKTIGLISSLAICFLHVIPKEFSIYYIGMVMVLSIFLLFLISIIKHKKVNVVDISLTFFGVCYVVIFSMFVALLRGRDNGKFLVWYIFIGAWITDTFAYFVGKNFGKHHFTKVSPNKTIEGSIGGTILSVVFAVIFTLIINSNFNLNINYYIITLIAFVLSIIGQIGDLAASCIKRYTGVKDYSNLIPGHGGMLDRIDSVIFIAPFAYFLITLLV